MKRQLIFLSNIIFVVILIGLSGCTRNPIGDTTDIIDLSIIKGKVTLNDNATPDNVFIWLQDSDATARTDETGSFELHIPSATTQTGGGLNGIYKLYFYLANYTLDSANVFIRNGLAEFNSNDIDKNGTIRKNIRLNKLLDISTSIEPASISTDFVGYLTATITLQTTMDTVFVNVSKMTPYLYQTITKFLLHKKDSEMDYPKIIEHPMFKGTAANYYEVTTTPVEIYLISAWPPLTDRVFWTYESGKYTIYPHIVVTTNQYIPEGLLEHIEGEFLELGKDYLYYPLKYNNTISFTID